jgi:hypothetical protein
VRKQKELSGNPDATLTEARAMTRAAEEEVVSRRPYACRQAAQKVWLAATTAADAVAGPRKSKTEVLSAFQKAWGSDGKNVAASINAALHVGVHYSNAYCDLGLIKKHTKELRAVIARPVRDPQMRARLRRRSR